MGVNIPFKLMTSRIFAVRCRVRGLGCRVYDGERWTGEKGGGPGLVGGDVYSDFSFLRGEDVVVRRPCASGTENTSAPAAPANHNADVPALKTYITYTRSEVEVHECSREGLNCIVMCSELELSAKRRKA
jgi:hypothetical protein